MINIFDDVLPDSYWKKRSKDFYNYSKIELIEKLIEFEKENLHLRYVCRESLKIFKKLNELSRDDK
tara:strand:- start:75 stop:272 length:198 start_codon:yes stop_codon:yes gene_type:complete